LTSNGFLPGGGGKKIKHNTENNPQARTKHSTQNYTTINKTTQQEGSHNTHNEYHYNTITIETQFSTQTNINNFN
jgi:hypothetical protein